jgi:hypothetical protein
MIQKTFYERKGLSPLPNHTLGIHVLAGTMYPELHSNNNTYYYLCIYLSRYVVFENLDS